MPEQISPTGPEKRLLVGDTSALISLALGGALHKALEIAIVYVPGAVVEELENQARYSAVATDVLALIRDGRIHNLGIADVQRAKALVSGHTYIDPGEAEAVVLAEEQGIKVVITDDFEAFPELRQATQVRVHLSPYLIAALIVAGRLSLQEAKACFDRIARRRHWFDARLYQRARGYLDGLLAE